MRMATNILIAFLGGMASVSWMAFASAPSPFLCLCAAVNVGTLAVVIWLASRD